MNIFTAMFEGIDLSKIIKRLLSKGGEYADIFMEETQSTTILMEEDRIERVIAAKERGVGLRLIFDHHTSYGYTTGLNQRALMNLAGDVSGPAKETRGSVDSTAHRYSGTPIKRFVDERCTRPSSDLEHHISRYIGMVKRANDFVRACDKGVVQARVSLQENIRRIAIFNSLNLYYTDVQPHILFKVQLVGERDGELKTSYEMEGGLMGALFFDRHPPEDVAGRTYERLKLMLDAPPAPSGLMTVVISGEAGGTMIHEAIGHGLEADLTGEGLSVFRNRIGEEVASPLVTIVDDATLPLKRGSYRFDDEGTVAERTILVDNGVLGGYMYDVLSALKEGRSSTGNGRRQSFRFKPIPRMSNTMILPGNTPVKDIIASVNKGLFVKRMGGGQVNSVSGEFMFEVMEGYLIEGGRIGTPVQGATLTGNGPRILKRIDMIGDDMGTSVGTCGKDGQAVPVTDGMPTTRIPEMVVGGRI